MDGKTVCNVPRRRAVFETVSVHYSKYCTTDGAVLAGVPQLVLLLIRFSSLVLGNGLRFGHVFAFGVLVAGLSQAAEAGLYLVLAVIRVQEEAKIDAIHALFKGRDEWRLLVCL